MGKIQMFGTQQPLKDNSPLDMTREAFGGGMVEMTGSESDLHHATDPMGVFNKGVRGGSMQMDDAGMVDLDRAARPGWQSYDTPISANSKGSRESTSSYPRGGTRGGR